MKKRSLVAKGVRLRAHGDMFNSGKVRMFASAPAAAQAALDRMS